MATLFSGGAYAGSISYVSGTLGELEDYMDECSDLLESITGVNPGTYVAVTAMPATGFLFAKYEDLVTLTGYSGPTLTQLNTQGFYLKTIGNLVVFSGKTDLEVGRAMWKFFNKLGYRQWFPSSTWEHIPSLNTIIASHDNHNSLPISTFTGIYAGGGNVHDNLPQLKGWEAKNELELDNFTFGHSWGGIVTDLDPFFTNNSNLKSVKGNKLACYDTSLQSEVAVWSINKLLVSPAPGISLSIADGETGWSEALATNEGLNNTPTDRQIVLANAVQDELNSYSGLEDTRVCISAYGRSSGSPTVTLDPKLVVNVMTAFIMENPSYNDVVTDYVAAGATTIFPYSYMSVHSWDYDLPGSANIQKKDKILLALERTFTAPGSVKGYTCEGSPSFIPFGLGAWITSRMLVQGVYDSSSYDLIRNKFFEEAFSEIEVEAKAFWDDFIENPNFMLNTDSIHRMYESLENMWLLATNSNVIARVKDLIIYTRYVELAYLYSKTLMGPDKVDLFDLIHELLFRVRYLDLMQWIGWFSNPNWDIPKCVSSMALRYNIVFTPHGVSNNPPSTWATGYPSNTELQDWITDGKANNPLAPFDSIGYPLVDLVPITDWSGDTRAHVVSNEYHKADCRYEIVTKDNQTSITFGAKAGFIAQNHDAYIKLVDWMDQETVLEDFVIPPDQVLRSHTFTVTPNTKYIIEVDSGGQNSGTGSGIRIVSYPDCYITYKHYGFEPVQGKQKWYFYVPLGTTIVGGWDKNGNVFGTEIKDSTGSLLFKGNTGPGDQFFSITVPTGQDGKVWMLEKGITKEFSMMTVPNAISPVAKHLMIPKDLAIEDSLNYMYIN